MRYYDHEQYKKYKIIRDNINKYFMITENYNNIKKEDREFLDSILIDYIEDVAEYRSYFNDACKVIISKHRINKDDIKPGYYIVTYTELERLIYNKYNYRNISNTRSVAIMKNKYSTTFDYYYIIKIESKI